MIVQLISDKKTYQAKFVQKGIELIGTKKIVKTKDILCYILNNEELEDIIDVAIQLEIEQE